MNKDKVWKICPNCGAVEYMDWINWKCDDCDDDKRQKEFAYHRGIMDDNRIIVDMFNNLELYLDKVDNYNYNDMVKVVVDMCETSVFSLKKLKRLVKIFIERKGLENV